MAITTMPDENPERLEEVIAMFRGGGLISAIEMLVTRGECTAKELFGEGDYSTRYRSKKASTLAGLLVHTRAGRENYYRLKTEAQPWVRILLEVLGQLGDIAFAEEPSTDRTRAHAIILGNLRAFGVQDLSLEDGVIVAGKKRIKICPDCQTFIHGKKRLDFAGLVALLS